MEEEIMRLNSENKPTYDALDKKQRNFDLEREVNYIPNSKLSIPFSNCYMINHFHSGDLKMRVEGANGVFPHRINNRYSKLTSKSSKQMVFRTSIKISISFVRGNY